MTGIDTKAIEDEIADLKKFGSRKFKGVLKDTMVAFNLNGIHRSASSNPRARAGSELKQKVG